MTFGPSTSNAALADALDAFRELVGDSGLIGGADIDMLSEAAIRIRELDQLDKITLRSR